MFCARCICVLEIDLARRRAVQAVSACTSCVFLYAASVLLFLVLLGRVGRAYYCLVHVCLSVCRVSFCCVFVWVVHGRVDGTQKWHVGCCVRFALRCGGGRNG